MSNKTSTAEVEKNNFVIEPTPKKNFGFPKCYPLPIVRDSDEQSAPWNCVIGHLKEYSVEVSDEKDIELLFMQGFFGKGTLSRSTPQFLEKKIQERNASKKRKQPNQNEFLSLSTSSADKDENKENPAKRRKKDEIEVVLSDTSDSEDDTDSLTEVDSQNDVVPGSSQKPKNIESKRDEKETLQLSLEEAYFLSYGLGVLVVKDRDQPLDLMRQWHKFCEIYPTKNFPVMYTAYHHFRSKGWIVRSGIKYGCDFVLYKDGPPFYHSSYAVIVKPVKEKNFRDVNNAGRLNLTWSALAAVHRICSHTCKGVVILYVIKPTSISENKISTPFCVSQYQLAEVLVNRWVPSEEQKFDG